MFRFKKEYPCLRTVTCTSLRFNFCFWYPGSGFDSAWYPDLGSGLYSVWYPGLGSGLDSVRI